MDFKDPASYTDLSQGKIQHIDFHINVDFSTRTFDIEARYQLQEPVNGSLFLDSFRIDLKEANANGRPLEWEFDPEDEILGQRLQLKGFQDAKSVTVTGSFNNWSPDKGVMLKENGGWTLTTTAEPGKINYKFIVDGKYITDPANPQTEVDGNYTNSVMTIKQ